jgi:hypothetical protein
MANVKVFSNPNTSIVFTDEEGKFVVPNVKVGDYSFELKDGILLNLRPLLSIRIKRLI